VIGWWPRVSKLYLLMLLTSYVCTSSIDTSKENEETSCLTCHTSFNVCPKVDEFPSY